MHIWGLSEQQANQGRVALERCYKQGSIAVAVGRINVRARLDEGGCNVSVALIYSNEERRRASAKFIARRIYVSVGPEQALYFSQVTLASGRVQGRF